MAHGREELQHQTLQLLGLHLPARGEAARKPAVDLRHDVVGQAAVVPQLRHLQLTHPLDQGEELVERRGPIRAQVEGHGHRLVQHGLRGGVTQRVQQTLDHRLAQRVIAGPREGLACGSSLLLPQEAEELKELALLQEPRLVHVHTHPELGAAVGRVRIAQPVQHPVQFKLPELALALSVEAPEDLHVVISLLLREALLGTEPLQQVEDLLKHQAGRMGLHRLDAFLYHVRQHRVSKLLEEDDDLIQGHDAIAVVVALGKEAPHRRLLLVAPLPHREQELKLVQHAIPIHVEHGKRGLRLLDGARVAEPAHEAREFFGRQATRPCPVVAVEGRLHLPHLRGAESEALVDVGQRCLELLPVHHHGVADTDLIQELGHRQRAQGEAKVPEN
mmetsp:Transcript_37050/g.115325  ORF Transcript_37050/g.115325 Transcript_37050/m.115325 type:complete len:389 (+) Transcript_37050:432-1598(+)